MKLLNIRQKHLMAITYPSILESLQPLKVLYKNKMCFSGFNSFDGLDYAVIDHATVVKMNLFEARSYISSSLKLPEFHIRHLEIHQPPFSSNDIRRLHIYENPFSSNLLLKLLSTRTIIFSCPLLNQTLGAPEFNPVLTLVEILKKAPYLEEIDIKYTNIKNGNTWPNDFIKYSKAKCLKNLHLSISGLEFDIDDLAVLMKVSYSFEAQMLYSKKPETQCLLLF
uniref:Uncharacterized protein n=1 Tax=Panagrolaimus davidi TaxID=227884 RepID=A0A914PE13_9BILA